MWLIRNDSVCRKYKYANKIISFPWFYTSNSFYHRIFNVVAEAILKPHLALLHFSKCKLLSGLFAGPAHTELSILSTYTQSITPFHLYRNDIMQALIKALLQVFFFSNSWQLWKKQQYIIEFWLICVSLSLASISLVPYCIDMGGGGGYPKADVRAFCSVLGEVAKQEEMKDGAWPLEMQPKSQDAHRVIVSAGLVFSSLLLHHHGRGPNQFSLLAGRGTATQWVQPTYKYTQHWSRHTECSAVVDFFPRYNVTALSSVTPVMCCQAIPLFVSETSGGCTRSSAWLLTSDMCETLT